MSEFHSTLDKTVPGLKALIQSSLKFTLARDALTRHEAGLVARDLQGGAKHDRRADDRHRHGAEQMQRQAGLLSFSGVFDGASVFQ
jgi:hypothetical protein